MNCFLCLQKSTCVFDIFGGLEEGFVILDIPNIIEKYVYFKPKKTDSMLCNKCWVTIESFYIFCLQIEENHKIISGLNRKNNPEEKIKIENFVHIDYPDNDNICDETENNCQSITVNNRRINSISGKNETSQNTVNIENYELNNYDKSIAKKKKYTNKSSVCKATKTKFKNLPNDDCGKTLIKKKRTRNNALRNADAVDEKISKYMTLSCEICDATTSTLAGLKTHYRLVHQQKGYAICCNKKFFKRYLLVDHIDCHLNPDHFKCELCDKTFSVADCLKTHMKDIHETEKKIYYCDQCPKKFVRNSILMRHKAYHLPKESWQFPCEECGKIFPSKFYLTSHKTFSHNSIPTKVCYICAKDVPTNRYKKHMQKHDSNYEEEKVECEICKAKLNKRYINIHRQHHKEAEKEEFFCTICNHKSPNRRALYIHMRYTHAEGRNHECQICHKTFKRRLALRQHMATHTGDNLYSCPYCPKTFTYDSNFYIHKKKEHPQQIEIEKQKKKRTNFVKHMEKGFENTDNEDIIQSSNKPDLVEKLIIDENVEVKIEIYDNLNDLFV